MPNHSLTIVFTPTDIRCNLLPANFSIIHEDSGHKTTLCTIASLEPNCCQLLTMVGGTRSITSNESWLREPHTHPQHQITEKVLGAPCGSYFHMALIFTEKQYVPNLSNIGHIKKG